MTCNHDRGVQKYAQKALFAAAPYTLQLQWFISSYQNNNMRVNKIQHIQ